MPVRLSTGLVDSVQEDGCMKAAFHDGVIDIYSGSQPATADVAATGTKLVRFTKGSGAFTAGTKSTAQKDTATILAGVVGNVYAIVINGTTYSHTQVTGDTATTIAATLADKVNASKVVSAVSTAGVIVIRARYAGVSYTIANTGTTTVGNNVIANVTANARINGLQFGDSSGGVLSKETDTWSGVVLASGTAGYARFKDNAGADDDTANSAQVRMDGTVSTSNAFIVLSNINLVAGTTVTIDAASITRPKS